MITVNEADGGRYDCYLGGSLLCSYSITVDAHRYGIYYIETQIQHCIDFISNLLLESLFPRLRCKIDFNLFVRLLNTLITWFFLFTYRCTPPHKSTDYQKIYSDWCNEFEKYKSAMKSWEKKQVVCTNSN